MIHPQEVVVSTACITQCKAHVDSLYVNSTCIMHDIANAHMLHCMSDEQAAQYGRADTCPCAQQYSVCSSKLTLNRLYKLRVHVCVHVCFVTDWCACPMGVPDMPELQLASG